MGHSSKPVRRNSRRGASRASVDTAADDEEGLDQDADKEQRPGFYSFRKKQRGKAAAAAAGSDSSSDGEGDEQEEEETVDEAAQQVR